MQDILLHATSATCNNPADLSYANLEANTITSFVKDIKILDVINQKYCGYGGLVKEASKGYFVRTAERLRHKNRAISGKRLRKDFIRKFPSNK